MEVLQVPLDPIQLATKTCAPVITYKWLACPDSIHRPWRPVAAVPVAARPEASLHGPEGPHKDFPEAFPSRVSEIHLVA
jgi:hypothetical protein